MEFSIKQNPDMELAAVFTRRAPESLSVVTEGAKVYHVDEIKNMCGEIDVMTLCVGSATDLPEQGPEVSKYCNTIDSFDTHAKIPEYFERMDKSAKENGHISIPEFTSSVLAAYARAAYRLWKSGDKGAKTVFDIAPALLSAKSPDEIRKQLL